MRELNIGPNEAGQRFDKYLSKYLKDAPKSFIYKMLRKKNITRNGKKADGSEKLSEGDIIKMFMSDETIDKFMGVNENVLLKTQVNLDVVYEDSNIIIVNKPVGMLSQKAEKNDVSLNEYIIEYLYGKKKVTDESLRTFRPSVCNRLDRNTSGLVIAGCSLTGTQTLSKMLKDRTIDKYYYCIVDGVMTDKKKVSGYLKKDEKTNKVTVTAEKKEGSSYIETYYEPVKNNGKLTLLRIKLITGKPHQIRAHLAWTGHPIAGDYKYGNKKLNQYVKNGYGCNSQLLHAGEVTFPVLSGEMKNLSGMCIKADVPETFKNVIKGEFE